MLINFVFIYRLFRYYTTQDCSFLTLVAVQTRAQNSLHMFPRKLPTCCQQVVVMEFGKRHDTTNTTDLCPRQLVTDYSLVADLSIMLRPCYGRATGKLV